MITADQLLAFLIVCWFVILCGYVIADIRDCCREAARDAAGSASQTPPRALTATTSGPGGNPPYDQDAA